MFRREALLALPPDQRPGYCSDPRNRFLTSTSRVLIRPGHLVFAVLAPRRSGRPYLVTSDRHGVVIAGRFTDADLQSRLRTLCIALRTKVADDAPDLARLKALAHMLRRSLKPSTDGEPVVLRDGGE